MGRPYRNIGFFFLALSLLVVAGFTPRIPDTPFFGYFSSLGKPKEIPPIVHIHAVISLAWFAILIAQPFLIRSNRIELHRRLGKASVIVVIALLLTGIQMMKHFYTHGIDIMPRNTVLSLLSQSFTGLTLFTLLYALALFKRRNIYHHVGFMVGAALAVSTPGLARLGLFVVGGLPGILTVVALIYATLIGFMLYAKFRYHQAIHKNPYLLVIGLFLLVHAMDFVGSRTPAWLWLADKIVSIW